MWATVVTDSRGSGKSEARTESAKHAAVVNLASFGTNAPKCWGGRIRTLDLLIQNYPSQEGRVSTGSSENGAAGRPFLEQYAAALISEFEAAYRRAVSVWVAGR